MKQWWQLMFNEDYLKTYVDIVTSSGTERQVSFLRRRIKPGSKILDLACGHGRHSIALARLGFKVTGLDYSRFFLRLAAEEARRQKTKVAFIQKDMRQMDFKNKFDHGHFFRIF